MNIFQCILGIYVFIFLAAMGSLAVGSFIFAISGSRDLKASINSIHKIEGIEENHSRICNEFIEFIQFYATVKE